MVVILLGEDVVASGRAFATLRQEADPDGLATTILDEPSATVTDVVQAADALPFFGGRRFVGVRGLLQRLAKSSERGKGSAAARDQQLAELADYLGRVPETTTLVFWEATAVKLPAALERAAQAAGEVRVFAVPSRPGDLQPWLEGWLLDQARDGGVALSRDAAQRLAATAVANVRAAESRRARATRRDGAPAPDDRVGPARDLCRRRRQGRRSSGGGAGAGRARPGLRSGRGGRGAGDAARLAPAGADAGRGRRAAGAAAAARPPGERAAAGRGGRRFSSRRSRPG